MNGPRISWQILDQVAIDEYEYVQYKTYTEEGSFIPGDIITKKIQVWNNYLGTEDVQDALDCALVVGFKNFEDNFLLNLMDIKVIGRENLKLEIDVDRGVISIGDLSGVANTGTNSHETNYRTIELSIGPIPNNIKSELKGLYFYLEYSTK
jgi:hypothetical protein